MPDTTAAHDPSAMPDGAALAQAYLAEVRAGFAALKTQADRAIAQVADDELWRALDGESNSVGVIMRHLAGNFRSRFRDFLESDGEKPDRARDDEFEAHAELDRAALLDDWDGGWTVLTDAVAALTAPDLLRTVRIRGEPHGVVQALERAVRHAAGHVGQIVLLAKHHRGAGWQTLSIPRGASAAFTAATSAAQRTP